MRQGWSGDFEREAATRIRNGDFKKTSLYFLRAMQGTPFAGPAKRVANAYVGIDGWDGAAADFARLAATGRRITAIGLDLTGHNEGPDPILEFALYDDSAFRFSGSLDEVRAKAAEYGAPWLGRFADSGGPFTIRNIRELYGAIQASPDRHVDSHQTKEPTATQRGLLAAIWYLYFRVHHAVARDLAHGALPAAMKVVVGQHDFGPWFADVYEGTGSPKAVRAGERIAAARMKASMRSYDDATEKMIADFKRHRSDLAGWKPGHNEDKRQQYADYLKARHAVIYSALDLPQITPVWEMSEPEFKHLLQNVRAARESRKLLRAS